MSLEDFSCRNLALDLEDGSSTADNGAVLGADPGSKVVAMERRSGSAFCPTEPALSLRKLLFLGSLF